MKNCRTCNQTKPANAYRGTRSACRECENAATAMMTNAELEK